MGEKVGYNAQQVAELRTAINEACKESVSKVSEELTSWIVKPMSTAWYAEEAQTYFEGFKEQVKSSCTTIQQVFDGFRANILQTATDWANATGAGDAGIPELTAIDTPEIEFSVEAIENMDGSGNRFLDEDAVQAVIGDIPSCEEAISSDLQAIAQKLDASASFLGGGQAAAMQDCFVKVAEAVHQIFQFILTGDKSLNTALTDFKTKYTGSAANVATSYKNADVKISQGE